MDERAAFEVGIDANPLDATNHTVYADWLQEHGEQEEADFRRKMGHLVTHSEVHQPDQKYLQWRLTHEDLNGAGFAREFMPPPFTRGGVLPDEPDHIPRFVAMRYTWPTYRGMEQALRQAHQGYNADPERQAEKLSRRQLVLKYRRS